jgi:hypothetical protein
MHRDGTLHEFNAAYKFRRAAAQGEGFMGFNVAMARRALIPHYDLGAMADCLRGLCDPGKGLPSSRISATD